MLQRWPLAIVFVGHAAAADPVDTAPSAEARPQIELGSALPYTASPSQANGVVVHSGWDGAHHDFAGRAAAELVVIDRVSIIGGALHEPESTWRPYAGAKLAIVPGVAAVSVAYKAEGFNQPEGEIEITAALGHRVGAAYVMANGSYGQDVDAQHRDAEAGAAVSMPIGAVVANATSRARFGFGSMTELKARWDLVADAGATLPFGRYAARAAIGVAAVETTRLITGPLASLLLAAYF